MIKVEDLRKTYRAGLVEVPALRGVSFEVERGEYVAIVGPSGSGKSTLMHLLGCLDVPSGGRYMLDGVEVSTLGEDELARVRNRKIGFVFQGFHLLPRLTALENVELPLVYRGVDANTRREKAVRALEMVGLGARVQHYPNELSGGEQQRVAIARAMVGEPILLLADEPTGNLDSRTGAEVLDLFQRINDAGCTVVMVTHDMTAASRAKRLLKIRDGVLEGDERV
ncbi:MAG: ABC transporter ATP-binding protein [Candidatus Fermentithermobacillus carboniphilus]|uniref:ABC transporter ATP-binding protein n=1 Tax=Candidatus Fermentithermobacillus carboniphilus TaxID=3085328 RepID=A0AAT9L9X6_9FIRM|nr:MAG: ABC transporter ATP-binding protein [Candidatus Fermentithermobacillus carboniphilus]